MIVMEEKIFISVKTKYSLTHITIMEAGYKRVLSKELGQRMDLLVSFLYQKSFLVHFFAYISPMIH